ncbi:MAG TPA: histidine phosphatase family protein [Burkholderiaceae bacterium]|nr:histidine phosphatase family protein [Burkholderiaceae bacterium]
MSQRLTPPPVWDGPTDTPLTLLVWRHPRPDDVAGRCVGRTDVAVDPRRAKRLARRIQATARRDRLAHVVYTSPLRRGADVGKWLRRWGWVHRVDDALLEADFGAWEGQDWSHIRQEEVDAWCADFAHHAPGGGEALSTLVQRASAWQPEGQAGARNACGAKLVAAPAGQPERYTALVVGHAGWMLARHWARGHAADDWPTAADWPPFPGTPGYGQCWRL